jgi:hypothetical protein
LMLKCYVVSANFVCELQLREQMDIKFKKQFPTRKELEIISSTRMWKRRDKAAKTIQRAYRRYKRSAS